jgi:CRP-like cAMP-binding protein
MLDKIFLGKKTFEVDKGKIIVYESHQVTKIYRIKQGYVKVYTVVGVDRRRIIFIYKPGDVFPLTTYLSGQKVARFFYEALSPTTLQYITPKQLENSLKDNLELGEEILHYTFFLDKEFLGRVNSMVSEQDALSKVKTLLNFLCDRTESKANLVTIDMPISHIDIADMCGITAKESLRQLSALRTLGIIVSGDGCTIDRQKLKKLPASLS